MEAPAFAKDGIAELKLFIIREQERVADLQRRGQRAQSRSARDRLLELMHRLDVLQALRRSIS